jgi:hypothetical protein
MKFFARYSFILSIGALASCISDAPSDNVVADADTVIALPDTVYFWKDVAPVVFENCTPCHYEDGAGPFPLTTYAALKKRTKTIRYAIADGYMPPWPADTSYSRFKGEKTLTAYERAVILKWVDQGAQEGSIPAVLPEPLKMAEAHLGAPDLILRYPEVVKIEGDNRDKFLVAKLAFELEQDTVVKAMYFKPGNKQLIHHVNGHLVNYAFDKKDNVFDGEWIQDAERVGSPQVYESMKVAHDDGTYPPLLVSAFNYLPGVEPLAYPEGIGGAFMKRKGAFLLNTLHFGPSPLDTTDQSELHLYFAEKRPERPTSEIHMGTLGVSPVEPEFVIPADAVSAFSTRFRLKEDISILTLNPHMHLLGKSFSAYAISPDKKDTIPLIRIPDWDFRWQYFYTFETMLKVPKGYEIVAEAIFDNTIENPFNPNIPPKTMRSAGAHMKTTDEMFQFFITYVPFRPGDENIKL